MASKSKKRRRKRTSRQDPQAKLRADRASTEDEAEGGAPASASARRSSSRPRGGGRNIDDERPPAPWGSFPLVELAVLVGLIILVVGFITGNPVLVITGLVTASAGGFELSIREHFSGFRSHTLILAGIPAAITLGVLTVAGALSPGIRVGAAAAVFALSAWQLTRIFKRKSGGHMFKLSPLRSKR